MSVPLIEPTDGNSGGDTFGSSGQYHTMGQGPATDATAQPEGTAIIFQTQAGERLVLHPDDLIIGLLVLQMAISSYIALTN